jgi:hypothetical protein
MFVDAEDKGVVTVKPRSIMNHTRRQILEGACLLNLFLLGFSSLLPAPKKTPIYARSLLEVLLTHFYYHVMKLQKVNLKACLYEVREILDKIRDKDLLQRKLTPLKRDVYGELIAKLETKLSIYEAALAEDANLSTKMRNWYDGVDLKKSILELRDKTQRIWDGLNQGIT